MASSLVVSTPGSIVEGSLGQSDDGVGALSDMLGSSKLPTTVVCDNAHANSNACGSSPFAKASCRAQFFNTLGVLMSLSVIPVLLFPLSTLGAKCDLDTR